MSKLTRPSVKSLQENKRELFDGMRAYHQSEISHTNHAITILSAITGAVVSVIVALLLSEKQPEHVTKIAWWLFGGVTGMSLAITIPTCLKIYSDHKKYKNYGSEYKKTCELLGFYNQSNGYNENLILKKRNETPGEGKGYKYTIYIIISLAILSIILTFLFALSSGHFLHNAQQGPPDKFFHSAPPRYKGH